MRPMGVGTAWRCEMALTERCRCRCAGTLHGSKRVRRPKELANLPPDDPHFALSPEARRHLRRYVGDQTAIPDTVPERALYGRAR